MSQATISEAKRIRERDPYTSAKQAVSLARWRVNAPQREDGDEWQADGFTLRLAVEVDDEPFDTDVEPKFVEVKTAETVPNPSYRGDPRRPGSEMPFAETPDYPRSERIAYYRQRGASRSVAVEMAERDMRRELVRWTWDYGVTPYIIEVTASKAGVVLGRAALCGVDLGDDYGDAARYVGEVAADLEGDALRDARETAARISST